jgi:hypothetical protein
MWESVCLKSGALFTSKRLVPLTFPGLRSVRPLQLALFMETWCPGVHSSAQGLEHPPWKLVVGKVSLKLCRRTPKVVFGLNSKKVASWD